MIDECLCKAVAYRGGRYHLEEPLTGLEPFDFPELGVLNCYYVDHEESRTLPRFFPEARTIDFKLCMDDVTVETLRVMKRLGLSRKDRVQVGDQSIVPRDLVVSLLPDPKDLAGRMRGKTCVGTLAKGLKNGEPKAYYIYNVTDHETVFAELGVQATAYQTGIPPVIAARLIAQRVWRGTGVMSPEQFDPDPFLERWPARVCPGTCEMIRHRCSAHHPTTTFTGTSRRDVVFIAGSFASNRPHAVASTPPLRRATFMRSASLLRGDDTFNASALVVRSTTLFIAQCSGANFPGLHMIDGLLRRRSMP